MNDTTDEADRGEGEPAPGGPEFENVEQERDYWRGLATSYAAKLAAVRHALAEEWAIEEGFIVQKGGGPRQSPSLSDIVERTDPSQD